MDDKFRIKILSVIGVDICKNIVRRVFVCRGLVFVMLLLIPVSIITSDVKGNELTSGYFVFKPCYLLLNHIEPVPDFSILRIFPRKHNDIVLLKTGDRRFFLPGTDFEKSTILVRILLLVTVYSSVSMLILLIIILLHRNSFEKEARLRQELKEKYQGLLMDYLFDEGKDSDIPDKMSKIAGNSFKRVILMEEIRDITVNLSGDAADKLRSLYYRLNLDVDSRLKTNSIKWHIKIKGFRELAFMNIKSANEEIIKCLHSKNGILRMEAQIALVRLNDNDRFSFLDHLQRPFTLWEQMNVHEIITAHNLEVPDFNRWLSSDNHTVVLFALRMIMIYKQKQATDSIISLLDMESAEVRKKAIYVLGELKENVAVVPLKRHYKYEVYENQLEIIVALGKIADKKALGFLVKVLDKEDDVQLEIEAAKALRNMDDAGKGALEKLMNSDYKNYKIIIKHVLDKRI